MAETVEPDLILGGEIVSNKKKPKKFTNAGKKWKEGSHTDSVLSVSLNHSHKNILASGSADRTVKIWDLSQGKNIYSSSHH
jgi:periodic tryptophan protein 1